MLGALTGFQPPDRQDGSVPLRIFLCPRTAPRIRVDGCASFARDAYRCRKAEHVDDGDDIACSSGRSRQTPVEPDGVLALTQDIS